MNPPPHAGEGREGARKRIAKPLPQSDSPENRLIWADIYRCAQDIFGRLT